MVNTTKIDRVQGLTVVLALSMIVPTPDERSKLMAIPDHKTRYSVTLDDTLIEIMKNEATERGVHAAQLATHIIETHFANSGKFTPEQSAWRTKLKNQTAA